jgi:membrane protein YqaA with SNARE-associated domain
VSDEAPPVEPSPEGMAEAPLVDRSMIVKTVVGVGILLAVAALLAAVLLEPITAVAEGFRDRFGLVGLFLGIVITDTSPLPMTHEPILLLGVSSGVNHYLLWGIASAASVFSGLLGYSLGAGLVSRSWLGAWIDRRYPGFVAFMKRHGAKGVAVAALLPLPFALATWSAGMVRCGLGKVMLASLLRIPKAGFYLWLIVTGWSWGGG